MATELRYESRRPSLGGATSIFSGMSLDSLKKKLKMYTTPELLMKTEEPMGIEDEGIYSKKRDERVAIELDLR